MVQVRFLSEKVPGVLSSMWDRPAVCNNVGATTYHLADARNAFVHFFFKEKLPDEQLLESENSARQGTTAFRANMPTARGRNLIIIQVESLQFVVDLNKRDRSYSQPQQVCQRVSILQQCL